MVMGLAVALGDPPADVVAAAELLGVPEDPAEDADVQAATVSEAPTTIAVSAPFLMFTCDLSSLNYRV
jgi:hypothetical protein